MILFTQAKHYRSQVVRQRQAPPIQPALRAQRRLHQMARIQWQLVILFGRSQIKTISPWINYAARTISKMILFIQASNYRSQEVRQQARLLVRQARPLQQVPIQLLLGILSGGSQTNLGFLPINLFNGTISKIILFILVKA